MADLRQLTAKQGTARNALASFIAFFHHVYVNPLSHDPRSIAPSNIIVQDYHKAFYRPDNLCLIINGKIQPEQVFPVLAAFEDKIVSKVRAAELTPLIITSPLRNCVAPYSARP